jgi:Holliday junction resolvase
LNIKALVNGIPGIIPGGISIKDFSVVSDTDLPTAREILDNLVRNGIGTYQNDLINFKSTDKLKAGIFAIKQGTDFEEVAAHLDWKDFEGLTNEMLRASGFDTTCNLILKKPRREIDVVGVKLGVTILIDCKHWKKQSFPNLKKIVKKQVSRVKQFINQTSATIALPAIVTLHDEKINFIDNVPIIPITKLSSFLDEFYGNLDKLNTIETL